MARATALLSANASPRTIVLPLLLLTARAALLASAPKQALLKIPIARLQLLDALLERSLPLGATLVLGLVELRLRFELDVLLLRYRYRLGGKTRKPRLPRRCALYGFVGECVCAFHAPNCNQS